LNLSAEIKRGAKSADNGPNEEEDVVEHEYSQRREPIVIIKKLLLSRPITHKERKTQCSEKERGSGVVGMPREVAGVSWLVL